MDVKVDDSFTFYDDKYSKAILHRINQLRHHGAMCDVVIKAEDTEFLAHRNILSASSDYFFAMFNGNMKESSQDVVTITGVTPDSMRSILNFIYTGEIVLDWDNVELILQGANLMLVQSVKDACCRFLESRLNVSNCLGIQSFSETYACHELWHIASRYVYQNFVHVSESDEFLAMSPKNVAILFSSDEISVENEEKVYEALVRWVNHDLSQRRDLFPELLELIRLPLVSPYYLVDVVEKEELMTVSPRCVELLLEAQHFHMLPDRRSSLDNARTKPRNYERFHEMLIAIGGNGDFTNFTTAYAFNVITSQWSDLPKLPKDRGYHGVTGLGGQLYVAGGYSTVNSETLDSVIRYDVREKQWHPVPSMNTRRSKHGMVEVDGSIYVIGGFDGTTTVNTVESYSVQTNRWKVRAPMPTRRRCVCAVAHGKFIYVIGGHDGSSILNTVERYDTTRDVWSSTDVQPMRDRRSFPCAVVCDDSMYVMGGYDGNDTLRSVEMYNFSSNQWTPLPSMFVPRSNAGAAVFNKKIYLVAGWDGISLNSVENFDITTQEWQRLPSLPRPTTGVRCCFLSFQSSNEQKPKSKNNKGHLCIVC
ncbi:kelch-like protein 12 [Nematostella vectensis]|uniref:kelch-like protein 12 n=1 Tax=Nematostella vectensis TaxID=45351 RepID=UPI001390046C|nr:kelch-like protein 12 [Nematostella vectensis]